MRARSIAIALLALVVLAGCSATSAPAPTGASGPVATGRGGLSEQKSDAGAVTVAAGWSESGPVALTVSMDTHSVDLDGFDLATLARVRLDGGAWIAPSAWDAPKGGHHRSGTLTFASLDRSRLDAAKVIEVEIRNVAAPTRLFRWVRG